MWTERTVLADLGWRPPPKMVKILSLPPCGVHRSAVPLVYFNLCLVFFLRFCHCRRVVCTVLRCRWFILKHSVNNQAAAARTPRPSRATSQLQPARCLHLRNAFKDKKSHRSKSAHSPKDPFDRGNIYQQQPLRRNAPFAKPNLRALSTYINYFRKSLARVGRMQVSASTRVRRPRHNCTRLR